MTPKETIAAVVDHREVRPVPYLLSIDEPVARRMDEHFGSPQWRQRLKNYFLYTYAVDYMHKDPIGDPAQGLSRDLFGSIWKMGTPMHLEKPAMSRPSFEGFDWPRPEHFYVKDADLASIRADCLANTDRYTLGCIWWGLMETSWGLRGFENILMDCAAEEDFYEELLERITLLYLDFVDHTCTLPVDGILFGDDWGDQRGVIIGPDRWRRFMKPRWARIYDRVHSHGKKVFTHCCGSIVDIMDDLVEIGLDVLESCQPEARGMNPYALKKRWGDKMTFWGCLGSQSTMPFGTPDQVTAEVRRLCREMGAGGGYILAAAKSLQSETPTANAVAALEAFTNQQA
ncbi:MAG: hypothetical protein LLG01_07960 [Planctomycetaceae bacterium]|nr:hypothetical protein [Planctomycetaceae bacterium]